MHKGDLKPHSFFSIDLGVTRISSVCLVITVGIFYSCVFSLGAYHDGKNNDCDVDGPYVMGTTMQDLAFSSCSKLSFSQLLDGQTDGLVNCQLVVDLSRPYYIKFDKCIM